VAFFRANKSELQVGVNPYLTLYISTAVSWRRILMRPCCCAIQYKLLKPHPHRGRGRYNSTSEDIYQGNNIATPNPIFLLGRCRKQKQNTDYGGKTLVAGKTEPRVAASLGEPMLLRRPDEGCPSVRTIYRSDGTMAPPWRDLDLFSWK